MADNGTSVIGTGVGGAAAVGGNAFAEYPCGCGCGKNVGDDAEVG